MSSAALWPASRSAGRGELLGRVGCTMPAGAETKRGRPELAALCLAAAAYGSMSKLLRTAANATSSRSSRGSRRSADLFPPGPLRFLSGPDHLNDGNRLCSGALRSARRSGSTDIAWHDANGRLFVDFVCDNLARLIRPTRLCMIRIGVWQLFSMSAVCVQLGVARVVRKRPRVVRKRSRMSLWNCDKGFPRTYRPSPML